MRPWFPSRKDRRDIVYDGRAYVESLDDAWSFGVGFDTHSSGRIGTIFKLGCGKFANEDTQITDEIRGLISEGRSVQDITRAAAKVGHKPLRYDGLKKALLGLTTIDEIEQSTSFEWTS